MGLVLAGGGARGAYEAGVLSVLQPALEAEQARPSVVVGTSVGAINAAHVAAAAQLPAAEGAQNALDSWSGIDKGDVIRPILSRQAPLTFIRYAGEILSLPGVRLPSLLDPGPLDRNLERWIDWPALHANVADGLIRSVAVVTTGTTTGRTVAFVESKGEEGPDPTRAVGYSHSVGYSPTRLTPDHIRASAAIPILFPPVELEDRGRRGWYVDGGTRLNTPIKPGLDLGAERLVIIATGAVTAPDPPGDGDVDRQPPDFGDGALHLLEGALVDPLVEDLHRLGRINTFLSEGGAKPMRRFRSARGQRPYNRVPFIFVAPERPHAIGELAKAVFDDRYRGVRGLRSPDMRFLNRLIGGDSPSHGELLSYLLFDGEFMRELIAMGQADAKRCLAGGDGGVPWRYTLSPEPAAMASSAPA